MKMNRKRKKRNQKRKKNNGNVLSVREHLQQGLDVSFI
jgi:hypothetical protein